MISRRSFLSLASLGAGIAAFPVASAEASVFRAIGLDELVRSSESVLVVTPLASEGRWEVIGKRRRIVTYTRVRVEDALLSRQKSSEEMVRTLGGRVDDIGQVVHGEAMLALQEQSLLFLSAPTDEGARAVTAMAQGHYPLLADKEGIARLRPSPRLGELLDRKQKSAVEVLSGRKLIDAAQIIRQIRSR